MNQTDYYVYIHIRPDTGIPFYIGKGRRNRAYDRWNRNQYWKRIVDKHGLDVRIIAKNLTNEYALKLECRLISLYRSRLGSLSNLTDGGEGISGFKFSQASKEKMSRSRKGRTFHSEYSAIMSAAKRGIKFTAEHRRNQSIAAKEQHRKRREAGLPTPSGANYKE